jgi:16S rRNA processing protein RimM
VRRAHGVRGALLIESKSDVPGAVFAPGRVVYVGSADGRKVDPAPRTITAAREVNLGWIVSLDGLDDRTVAESWKARTLFAEADTLPPPDPDEVYLHDLMGLEVFAHDGVRVGAVCDVYEAPQGLLIEVDTARGRRLVPWREELIAEADWNARTVRLVDLPGLLD